MLHCSVKSQNAALCIQIFYLLFTVPIFVLSTWAAPLKIILKWKLNLQTHFVKVLDLNQILIVLNSSIETVEQNCDKELKIKVGSCNLCVFHTLSFWLQSDVWSPSALLERVAPSHGRLWRPAQEWAVRSPDWPHPRPPLPAGWCSYLLLHGSGEATHWLIIMMMIIGLHNIGGKKWHCNIFSFLN